MGDVDDESALCALLSHLRDNDDASIADRAIALYLSRFDDDAEAKRQAIARLTRMLAEWPGEDLSEREVLPALRQKRPH